MSDHKTCDYCGKEIEDPASNVEMTQLTTWEDDGGAFAPGESYQETLRDFCNMKCTAQFTHGKLLKAINGSAKISD